MDGKRHRRDGVTGGPQTQELPVPLLGFRLDYPFSDRINLYGSLDGGYLPWVNSLRTEGGTVDLTQSHADLALGLSYAWLPSLSLQAGFQYTYFVQHEKSHEDDKPDSALGTGAAAGGNVSILIGSMAAERKAGKWGPSGVCNSS